HGVSPHEELWSTDGSKSGTFRLSKHPDVLYHEYYTTPVLFRGHLYFEQGHPDAGSLWITDGTKAGTHTYSGWFDDAASKPTAFGPMAIRKNSIYFSALDKMGR